MLAQSRFYTGVPDPTRETFWHGFWSTSEQCPEVRLKSAGPAGTDRRAEEVRVLGSSVIVRWPNFMLPTPKPAEK